MTTSYKNSQSKHSKFAWWQLVAAIALVAVGVLIGKSGLMNGTVTTQTGQADTPEATEPKAVMAVEAVRPAPLAVEKTLSANGVIAAVETAEVSGQISGVAIERVLVEVGDRVRAGQVLAVLDTRTFTQQLRSAEAELATAIAAREKAQADLARTEPLLAIDAVSRQEVDAYRTALKQADANVAAARANVDTARTNQSRGNITAPVDGIISAKSAQVGTVVSGAPLFSIIKNGILEWQAAVSPSDAASIRVGQSAQIDIAGRMVTGQVTRLSPVANDSRDMTVHVRLPAGSGASAGMYQSGKFIFDTQTHPAIPMASVMTSDGYDYVWLLTATDEHPGLYRVQRQNITVIAQQDGRIATDLPTEALVVASSVSFLNDNDLVTVATIDGKAVADIKATDGTR